MFNGDLAPPCGENSVSICDQVMDFDCGCNLPEQGMVRVAAGAFMMGDPHNEGWVDEFPVHEVNLPTYDIDIYETTNADYVNGLNWAMDQGLIDVQNNIVISIPGDEPLLDTRDADIQSPIVWDGAEFSIVDGFAMHPVIEVSWYGAVAYTNWRSVMVGRTPCYDTVNWTCSPDRGCPQPHPREPSGIISEGRRRRNNRTNVLWCGRPRLAAQSWFRSGRTSRSAQRAPHLDATRAASKKRPAGRQLLR